MSDKPGLLRRIFRFIGMLVSGIRHLFSLAILLFFIVVIFGMFAEDIQPIPERGALVLAPSGVLVDQKTHIDPLAQLLSAGQPERETLVSDLVEALELAATDQRITHLLLNTNYLAGGGASKLDEVGNALRKFRKSGKPVIAYSDYYTQQQFFLAAHADEVYLNPMGGVLLNGFSVYPSYFAEALEKLKINIHIFKAGDHKDAVEPFIRNDMSAESREHLQLLVDDLWDHFSARIEQARNLPEGALDTFIAKMPEKLRAQNGDLAQLAVSEGLVDKLMSRTELQTYLEKRLPAGNDGYAATPMRAYLNHQRLLPEEKAPGTDKIALIVAKGDILDGEQPDGTVGGDTLSQMFNDINEDENIKAVVLRVDSPGGSAFASEVIRDAIASTRQKDIPVVVSMGSYAASGGYWISAEADRILAMPTTLTGSIGVFIPPIPTFEDSLAALGIHSDGVSSSELAGAFALNRPMSPATESLLQQGVDNTYTKFVNLVAAGRDMTPEAVQKVAGGRIWSGQRAVDLGLVDELGDLNRAIEVAAELAGLSSYQIDRRRQPLTLLEKVSLGLGSGAEAALRFTGLDAFIAPQLRNKLIQTMEPLNRLARFNDPRAIYAFCFECPL